MGSTWKGDVTFVAHDTTDDGFQVTAFADSVANQSPFTDHGDASREYDGRGGLYLPPIGSDQVHALILTFGGDGAEDPVTEEYPPYQPAAQSDGGTATTGYLFNDDTVFVVMGMTGLNPDNMSIGFKEQSGASQASVRARWVGSTITLP